MTNMALNLDAQLVSCEVCLKSIPAETSNSVETGDYVAYFCGLECYEIWKQKSDITANLQPEDPAKA